ncbi:MAG: carnitine 3-dehydrogenase [Hyphomicrobiales bacterium]|nr:carnitine 3-dehydrogenase [Hyphomicrobiales bacterium]MDE2017152.1 carnitine 3-dehydrogenase [Hyphomicrobiales bacterium]
MADDVRRVAAIGAGVIGAGWVARFLLDGIDVDVHDPSPGAAAAVDHALANAERAWRKLTLAPLPERGRLRFHDTVAAAVEGAQYVQESAPERLDFKRRLLGEILAAAPAGTPVGSSTSGFTPSALRDGLGAGASRVFVAHPFNPVYLLPLVEVVGGEGADDAALARAEALFARVGMKPLRIAREIDAHVADRLLEAVWREALWLVKDGIATTEEIDDSIRFGFGLRWAQMGLFETYRIAGGAAGMRHFLAQFGPALKWPWTKLTDVPDLDDALVERIAAQSDAQANGRSIAELEAKRDDNLVGILLALKANDWGAGATLRERDAALFGRVHARAAAAASSGSGPMASVTCRAREDWADYNGHMTESRYLQVFGDATDAFLRAIGMDSAYLASGRSVFTVETHLRHLDETKVGETLRVTTRLLARDSKRAHVAHEMRAGDDARLVATAEQMLLHVDAKAGKASAFDAALVAGLDAIARTQAGLPAPDWVGRKVGGPKA